MTTTTTTFEVWSGSGEMRLSTADTAAAYQLFDELVSSDEFMPRLRRVHSWTCQNCPRIVSSSGGYDTECDCGAQYNAFGQRLRYDWRDNMSNYDDEVSDLDGYESSCLAREQHDY
jgi:hypothetical protein